MSVQKIKIDTDVPLPTHHLQIYPWKEMQVGHSFLLPKGARLASMRTMAARAGRDLKREFTIRKTPEGHRCWRVK